MYLILLFKIMLTIEDQIDFRRKRRKVDDETPPPMFVIVRPVQAKIFHIRSLGWVTRGRAEITSRL